jgi:two-component system OmpR family response regulator
MQFFKLRFIVLSYSINQLTENTSKKNKSCLILNKNKTMNSTGPFSVFLVDDDRMFLSTLKETLDTEFKNKLDISIFTSGEECLKNINGKPDMVILDYFLNEDGHSNTIDGIEVLKQIKKTDYRDILVVMLSGQDKLQIALDSIKNGAYEYVTKSESAFVRIKNIIKNASISMVSQRNNKSYVRWNIVLGIIISLIIFMDIIYYFLSPLK